MPLFLGGEEWLDKLKTGICFWSFKENSSRNFSDNILFKKKDLLYLDMEREFFVKVRVWRANQYKFSGKLFVCNYMLLIFELK